MTDNLSRINVHRLLLAIAIVIFVLIAVGFGFFDIKLNFTAVGLACFAASFWS